MRSGGVWMVDRVAGEDEGAVRVGRGERPVPAADGGPRRPRLRQVRRGPRQRGGGVRSRRPREDPGLSVPPLQQRRRREPYTSGHADLGGGAR